MKTFTMRKYRHAVPLIIYGIIYLTWFLYLERKVTKDYWVIHVALDDYIPFWEGFVIPYFLWFLYYRTCIFLFTGMTIFLTISTLFPNGHHLRPAVLPRDNIFTMMVSHLYKADTPTNLWPSIHVYNSLGAHFAIMKNNKLSGKRPVRVLSLLLCISIILSTMFIKQHSVFDVVTAFIMAAVMYGIVYKYDILTMHRLKAIRKKAAPQI